MKTKKESGYFDGYTDEDTGDIGAEVSGQDVIRLNAPKVILSPDTPLLTKAQDLAGAINELFQSGSGGGDEDWTFPEHWLDIPDPEPNQVIMYIEAEAGDVAPFVLLEEGNGSITYGDDGYTYEWPEGYGYTAYHQYQTSGQYIITITANNLIVNLNQSYSNTAFMAGHIIEDYQGVYNGNGQQCRCIRAIKVGSNITLGHNTNPVNYVAFGKYLVYFEFMGEVNNNSSPGFSDLTALKKIKIGISPESFSRNAFLRCYALEIADCLTKSTSIATGMFTDCRSLKYIDMPSATSHSGVAFNGCHRLKEINAPKLSELHSGDFSYCYSLQKLTLAEGCNINGNTFENCPQLYPKPQ